MRHNRAERDLRMRKVKQKVSGCFRSFQYAQAYCRISSYLQSMAYRGYNPLVAIQMALSGQIYAEGTEWLRRGNETTTHSGEGQPGTPFSVHQSVSPDERRTPAGMFRAAEE